mmetsp:Transcript_17442/g.52320  ORF Transcript_17442/g.52320 Transcript_17442/m.52320 type:complete len:790 (-) Transcript_17442:726-3095(-)
MNGRALAPRHSGNGWASPDKAHAQSRTAAPPSSNETSGFLQDLDAAESGELPSPTGASGGSSRSDVKCSGLWWLLVLPALVLVLLFSREWDGRMGAPHRSGKALLRALKHPRGGDNDGSDALSPSPAWASPAPGFTPVVPQGQPDQRDQPGVTPASEVEILHPVAAGAQGQPVDAEQQPEGEAEASAPQAATEESSGDQSMAQPPGAAVPGQVDHTAEQQAADEPAAEEQAAREQAEEEQAAAEEAAAADQPDSQTAPAPDSLKAEAGEGAPQEAEHSLQSSADRSGDTVGHSGEVAAPREAAVASVPEGGDVFDEDVESELEPKSEWTDEATTAAVEEANSEAARREESAAGAPKARLQARVLVILSVPCQQWRPALEQKCMATGAVSNQCKDMFKHGGYLNSYMSPFVRIASHMEKLGIDYHISQEVGPNSWHNPGKAWDAEVQAADVLVIEEHGLVHVMPSYPDKIYVVLQGNAAAALMTCSFQKTCAHDHLLQPQVKRYLQHTELVPLELNNAKRLHHLPHYQLMKAVHMDGRPEAEDNWSPIRGHVFTPAMLAKTRLLSPMFWRWRYPMTCKGNAGYVTEMAPSLDVPPGRHPDFLPDIADRPIDIAFSGSSSTPKWRRSNAQREQNALYAAHRGRLLEELERIREANPELRIEMAAHISYPEFVQLLRSSKIFVSPLGHGEYSGKDYEATISRAVMVKPLARHLASYPDIYQVNKTCVETRMDFSDLEGVVKGLLAEPARMQSIADGAYNLMVEHTDVGKFAIDVANMLHEMAIEVGLNVTSS